MTTAAEILSMHYSPSLRRGSDGVWAPDSSSTYLSTDASDTEGEEEQPSTMTLLASAGRDRGCRTIRFPRAAVGTSPRMIRA